MLCANAVCAGRFLVKTFAGTGEVGYLDGKMSKAKFGDVRGVAVDDNCNVYVADAGNNCVRKICAADGNVITLAGTGEQGFQDGPKDEAQFSSLRDIAIARSGEIFVADGSCIRAVCLESGAVKTIAGRWNKCGYRDGPASVALFEDRLSIAVDADGDIIVADRLNQCIRKVSTAHSVVWTLAGSREPGDTDGSPHEAQFNEPCDVALGPNGDIYIAEVDHQRIRKIEASTDVVTTVAWSAMTERKGKTKNTLGGAQKLALYSSPLSLSLDNDGRIHFVDCSRHCVRRIDLARSRVVTIASGQDDAVLDASCSAAKCYGASKIAVGKDGVVYVVDQFNTVIRSITEVSEVTLTLDSLKEIINQHADAPGMMAELREILEEQNLLPNSPGAADVAENTKMCLICYEGKLESLFIPCGHFVCCERCAHVLSECPICRESIDFRQRVYEA
eukprot:GEMP01052737.1.p1 GENE.GEMP01052737.1~~GEMP01052737.1.p1  ORF type:complete len:447 (+),score=117.31 GEMP01052737.1:203-1543(+)